MNKTLILVFISIIIVFGLLLLFDPENVYSNNNDLLMLFIDNSGSMKCEIGEKMSPDFNCVKQEGKKVQKITKIDKVKEQLHKKITENKNNYDEFWIATFKDNEALVKLPDISPNKDNNYGENCKKDRNDSPKDSRKFIKIYEPTNSIEEANSYIDKINVGDSISTPIGYGVRELILKLNDKFTNPETKVNKRTNVSLLVITDNVSNCGIDRCDSLEELPKNFDSKNIFFYF